MEKLQAKKRANKDIDEKEEQLSKNIGEIELSPSFPHPERNNDASLEKLKFLRPFHTNSMIG